MYRFSFIEFRAFHKCPTWWINFIQDGYKKSNYYPDSEEEYVSNLEKYAKTFNFIIEWVVLNQIEYLTFDTDEDFTFFKMKWI